MGVSAHNQSLEIFEYGLHAQCPDCGVVPFMLRGPLTLSIVVAVRGDDRSLVSLVLIHGLVSRRRPQQHPSKKITNDNTHQGTGGGKLVKI